MKYFKSIVIYIFLLMFPAMIICSQRKLRIKTKLMYKPSIKSKVIDVINANSIVLIPVLSYKETLKVIFDYKEWIKVKWKKQTGWIKKLALYPVNSVRKKIKILSEKKKRIKEFHDTGSLMTFFLLFNLDRTKKSTPIKKIIKSIKNKKTGIIEKRYLYFFKDYNIKLTTHKNEKKSFGIFELFKETKGLPFGINIGTKKIFLDRIFPMPDKYNLYSCTYNYPEKKGNFLIFHFKEDKIYKITWIIKRLNK